MILVTGSSGFIGNSLMNSFGDRAIGLQRANNPEYANRVVCDLSDSESVSRAAEYLGQFTITHLVHTAAVTPWSSSPDFSLDRKMAESVSLLCDRLNISQLISVSGWNVYNMTRSQPPFTEETSIQPIGEYGASKYDVEKLLNDKVEKSHVLHLRLASVYGVGQTSAGLIPNLVQSALDKQEISLNALQTKRDYLYIDDLIEAVDGITTTKEPIADRVLNIGSGCSVSVLEVAETIQDVCLSLYGMEVAIRKPTDPQESIPTDNELAIDRAKNYGLLSQTTPFRVGMEEYVKWRKNG